MLYCGRSSKEGYSSQRSGDLQYTGSAKYDVHGGDGITWKQQQQQQHLYNRQLNQHQHQMMMRQQPAVFLADRDYATTLQMRRSDKVVEFCSN